MIDNLSPVIGSAAAVRRGGGRRGGGLEVDLRLAVVVPVGLERRRRMLPVGRWVRVTRRNVGSSKR